MEIKELLTGHAIKFTVTQKTELLEWTADLAKKNDRTISGILNEAGVEKILSEARLNGPQKRQKIMDAVFNLRFPSLSDRLEEVRKAVNALKAPEGIRVTPVSPLEDNEFRLEITFASRAALEKRLETLKSFTSGVPFIKFTDLIEEKKEQR
jgi:hypothetical protein